MARRSYAGAAVQTTLSGSISSGAGSGTLAGTVTSWPTTPSFSIVVDPGIAAEEKILCTRSGSTLTFVTRGYDGTTAAAHSSGAVVYLVPTAVDFDEANSLVSGITAGTGIAMPGSSSGSTLFKSSAVAGSTTLTLPPETSTLVPGSYLQKAQSGIVTGCDTADRKYLGTTQSVTSGTLYLTMFTATDSITVSQVSMISGLTAGTAISAARMGLYTFDETTWTLVARTASDTSLFTSTETVYTKSFDTTGGYPATYALVAGTRYALGFIVVSSGTKPSFAVSPYATALSKVAPKVTATKTGQTDLVTPITVTDNAGFVFFGRFH
jgi:hypothetical protein